MSWGSKGAILGLEWGDVSKHLVVFLDFLIKSLAKLHIILEFRLIIISIPIFGFSRSPLKLAGISIVCWVLPSGTLGSSVPIIVCITFKLRISSAEALRNFLIYHPHLFNSFLVHALLVADHLNKLVYVSPGRFNPSTRISGFGFVERFHGSLIEALGLSGIA